MGREADPSASLRFSRDDRDFLDAPSGLAKVLEHLVNKAYLSG